MAISLANAKRIKHRIVRRNELFDEMEKKFEEMQRLKSEDKYYVVE